MYLNHEMGNKVFHAALEAPLGAPPKTSGVEKTLHKHILLKIRGKKHSSKVKPILSYVCTVLTGGEGSYWEFEGRRWV